MLGLWGTLKPLHATLAMQDGIAILSLGSPAIMHWTHPRSKGVDVPVSAPCRPQLAWHQAFLQQPVAALMRVDWAR